MDHVEIEVIGGTGAQDYMILSAEFDRARSVASASSIGQDASRASENIPKGYSYNPARPPAV